MTTTPLPFPEWVDKPKRQPRRQLAVKRLQFLVMNAALLRAGAGNIAAFAAHIGMERTTIAGYIRHGRFSYPAAALAEKTFGEDLIKKEWLTDPLDIAS